MLSRPLWRDKETRGLVRFIKAVGYPLESTGKNSLPAFVPYLFVGLTLEGQDVSKVPKGFCLHPPHLRLQERNR